MLKRKSKIILGTLLIAALSIITGVGTYAAFSTEVKTTRNEIKAGKLDIDLDTAGNSSKKVIVEMPSNGIYPGWSSNKIITVKNTGTIPFTYTMYVDDVSGLSATKLFGGSTPIQINVNDRGFVNINQLGVVSLGEVAANGSAQVTVAIKLPDGAADEYQGEEGIFKFKFEAVQK